MSIQAILLDVEGTMTAVSFVHDRLFPFARRRLGDWLRAHATDANIAAVLEQVCQDIGQQPSLEGLIHLLESWIDEDRKHGALKLIQGRIWKEGYEEGIFHAHVYPDVLPCFEEWTKAGLRLSIYSSGSVEAQKLLLQHSIVGDIRGTIQDHFDTGVGPKRDPESYRTIAKSVFLPPETILFLSDTVEELDAARMAGMATTQVCREGIPDGPFPQGHPRVTTFARIDLSRWGR